MNTSIFLGVIVVTHNHEATIGATLASLAAQTQLPNRVVVIDCGSRDLRWTEAWKDRPGWTIVPLNRNAGFTGGNNEGWRRLAAPEGLVLFLNPDVIAPPELLAQMRALSEEPRAQTCAAFSPRLVQWDFAAARATGQIDSTGLFPRRTGGWQDRRDDSPPASDTLETVPALCGAFFLARVEALRAVQRPNGAIWDERYFTYKEDLELSLRLRRGGFQLGLWHGGWAGHGRGWVERSRMSRWARLLSARNEVRLHATYAPWRMPYSVAKWLYVRLLER